MCQLKILSSIEGLKINLTGNKSDVRSEKELILTQHLLVILPLDSGI